MLKSPRFNRYKNPICLAFTSNVLEVLTDNAIAELATVTTDLQDAHDEMTAAFKKDLGSIKTLSLKELDKRRDDAIRGIAAVARGYEVHFDTTKKDAGMVIGRSIRKYAKSIAQLSYQAETVVIKNLINDWTNAPTLAAALTLLGLDDWKTELATANDAFDTMYLERSNEKAETISAASASKVREKVETQYQIAAQHINANAILNPSPTLTTLINQINALIDKYNAEAIRKGQAQEEEEAL